MSKKSKQNAVNKKSAKESRSLVVVEVPSRPEGVSTKILPDGTLVLVEGLYYAAILWSKETRKKGGGETDTVSYAVAGVRVDENGDIVLHKKPDGRREFWVDDLDDGDEDEDDEDSEGWEEYYYGMCADSQDVVPTTLPEGFIDNDVWVQSRIETTAMKPKDMLSKGKKVPYDKKKLAIIKPCLNAYPIGAVMEYRETPKKPKGKKKKKAKASILVCVKAISFPLHIGEKKLTRPAVQYYVQPVERKVDGHYYISDMSYSLPVWAYEEELIPVALD
jgi:hypothetical protein